MKNHSKSYGKGVITGLSHDGRGIAHVDGKTTFIEGALVGEEIEFEYLKRKSRMDEAKMVTVLQAAEGRQEPQCSWFNICGGCSLQHMDQQTQISHKQAVLLEQLQHIGRVIPKSVLPPITSAPWGYRRKARLGVRYVIKKQKLLIGFREKQGRYLADIESCSVLHPSIGQQIPLLREMLLSLEGYLSISQLEIAVGDHVTAIIIRHLEALAFLDQEKLIHFGQKHHYHIYLQPGGSDSVALLYPPNQAPRLNYSLPEYKIEMLFHPTDFVQVNNSINHKLINLAVQLLEPSGNDRILDLFCGIGNFTLALAQNSKHVLGIEGSDTMVQRGYENAIHNNIQNVSFECRNLADSHYNNTWMQEVFDKVLIDPPRTGAWEVMQYLPRIKATRIVYISCNPATLARDAGYLTANGYSLEKVGVLDMFSHTSHVESIALFVRQSDA